MGHDTDRHVSLKTNRQTATLLCQNNGSRGGVRGRASHPLEFSTGVHIPSPCYSSQGHQEDKAKQHHHHPLSTELAKQSVVHRFNPTVHIQTLAVAGLSQFTPINHPNLPLLRLMAWQSTRTYYRVWRTLLAWFLTRFSLGR